MCHAEMLGSMNIGPVNSHWLRILWSQGPNLLLIIILWIFNVALVLVFRRPNNIVPDVPLQSYE